MPYIPSAKRNKIDTDVSFLANTIIQQSSNDMDWLGQLNYAITRLIALLIWKKFSKLTYSVLAGVTGVLTNVQTELYLRIGTPYEKLKELENGDIDLFDGRLIPNEPASSKDTGKPSE